MKPAHKDVISKHACSIFGSLDYDQLSDAIGTKEATLVMSTLLKVSRDYFSQENDIDTATEVQSMLDVWTKVHSL